MKMISTAAALLLGAGVVYAQTPPSSQVPPTGQTPPVQTPPGASQSPTGDRDDMSKKHKMTAEVVSTDSSAKTITVKNLAMSGGSPSSGSSAGSVTLKLEDKAQDRISSLKSGDKVTLTCKGGDHSGSSGAGETPANPPSSGSSGMSGASGCSTVTDISKSY
jgi:hypothetical protein